MASVTQVLNSGSSVPDTSAPQGKAALGKEDFLKLLVAQLSNQDPLQPTQGAEFVAQLAQFSNLEQAMKANTTLSSLEGLQKSAYAGQAVNLIGKTVTAKGDTTDVGDFGQTSINANLQGEADSLTAKVYDANGNLVRTIAYGPQTQGPHQLGWDGKDDNGVKLDKGTYSVAIEARAQNGNVVIASTDITGVVSGVSMQSGVSKVKVGDAEIPLSRITNVK